MASPLVIAQHQDDAPPGLIAEWAADRGLATRIVRPDRDDPLPGPAEVDLVVLLGSDDFAILGASEWIDREARWLADLAHAARPVLGICFGAQLLAVVTGGARRRAARPEIGWIEVRSRDAAAVPSGPWFGWHADVIDPPRHAEIVARNDAGVQAFRVGPHLGVQFHPEVTPEIIDRWAGDDDGRELARAGIARRSLARQSSDRAEASAEAARRLFDGFLVRSGQVVGSAA